jgi:hypothetical protein
MRTLLYPIGPTHTSSSRKLTRPLGSARPSPFIYTALLVLPVSQNGRSDAASPPLASLSAPWVRVSLCECVPSARGSHSIRTSHTPCTQVTPPHPSVHPPRIVAGHIAAGHMLPIVHRFEVCAHASGAPPLLSNPLASCRALAVPSIARSIPPPHGPPFYLAQRAILSVDLRGASTPHP